MSCQSAPGTIPAFWARTQGPHDLLIPGGPMSCQSTPG
ncbi:unnamed protein product, partial [Staurois parvus]